MKSLLATCLIILQLFVAGCSENETSSEEAADTTFGSGPRPAPEVIAAAVDSLAQRVIAEDVTPALGVAVIMDGKTILAKSYGLTDVTDSVLADDRTLWYVASTSKSYTGFGVSLLAHEGVIDFKTPITALLPNAQWPAGVDATRLTLADFLGHTHQLQDAAIVMSSSFTAAFPESEWPAMLRYAKPIEGHDLIYSNLGYNVAAMVIDAKRPEGWRRYLDSAVYKPAGMTETYTRVSGLDIKRIAMPHELLASGRYATTPFRKVDATMSSAGGHLATMHDLARWIAVHMGDGMLDGKRVFPAEAVELSHRLIAKQTRERSKTFSFFKRDAWAAGWDLGSYHGEPMTSRFGSYASMRSHLSFLPARHIGAAVQANGRVGFEATDIIAAFAYDLERGDPQARNVANKRLQKVIERRQTAVADRVRSDSVNGATPPTLKRPLADFAGSYNHPYYGTITIDVRGDSVLYRFGAMEGGAEVIDARTCGWLGCKYYNALIIDVGGDTDIDFEFPDSGPATALKLFDERFVRR